MSDETWPSEPIPDGDHLYVFVHAQWIKHGRIVPFFFQNRPDERTGAMSTDWSKYSTPEATRQRARKPHLNAVGRLLVGQVRAIPLQDIVHTPIQNHPTLPDNRAHTDVRGPKQETDLDIQDHFAEICELILPVPEP